MYLQLTKYENQLRLLGMAVAALVTIVILASTLQASLIAVLLVAAFAGLAIFSVPPAQCLNMYIYYLMFEGMLKILSNYNPVIHVGSDLLLIAAFVRLWTRKQEATGYDYNNLVKPRIMAIVSFLVLFWIWVAAQFFNPWGLGVIPSLAALKVYLVPMIMFFTVAFLLTEDEFNKAPFILLALGIFQAIVALIDWKMGPSFVPSLHPRYMQAVGDRFVGVFYRPFGTTNLAGGPSIWMFHCSMAFLFVAAYLKKNWNQLNSFFKWRWTAMSLVFIPFCVSALLVCQVRSIMLRTLVLLIAGLVFFNKKTAMFSMVAFLAVGGSVYSSFDSSGIDGPRIEAESSGDQVLGRITSLNKKSTWENARHGALDAMLALSDYTILGIGLSRTGASASPWKSQILADPFFGIDWAFTDNLFRTLFTEVGLGGLVAFILLMFVVLMQLKKRGTYCAKMTMVYCSLVLLTGFASEGVLYQPDASMMWLWIALGLRTMEKNEV